MFLNELRKLTVDASLCTIFVFPMWEVLIIMLAYID